MKSVYGLEEGLLWVRSGQVAVMVRFKRKSGICNNLLTVRASLILSGGERYFWENFGNW
jgi:hypothetical protein